MGKSEIEILVRAKPKEIWIAKAVPIYAGSDNSEIIAEYWGESGTIVKPQMIAIETRYLRSCPVCRRNHAHYRFKQKIFLFKDCGSIYD